MDLPRQAIVRTAVLGMALLLSGTALLPVGIAAWMWLWLESAVFNWQQRDEGALEDGRLD